MSFANAWGTSFGSVSSTKDVYVDLSVIEMQEDDVAIMVGVDDGIECQLEDFEVLIEYNENETALYGEVDSITFIEIDTSELN